MDFKEKQHSEPILLELKVTAHNGRVEVFSKGADGVLRYLGRQYVPYLGELRKYILQ